MSAPAKKSFRILGIDRVKGTLILLILFYHSLNYSERYYLGFKLLGWAPVSFILVTGVLISRIYGERFERTPVKAWLRLWSRGAKLALLFTCLNIGICLLRKPTYQSPAGCIQGWLEHWWDIYVTGEGRYASFQILLPIAYFLLLAPALLWMERLHRWWLPASSAIILPGLALLDYQNRLWTTCALISAAIPGMLAGRLPIQTLNRLCLNLGTATLVYLGTVAFGAEFGQTYLVQMLEACAGLALVYSICLRFDRIAPRRGWVAKFGEYSLPCYILQIAALQVLVKILGRPDPVSARFLLLMVAAGTAMGAMICAIDWSRSRSQKAAVLYKTVFA